MDRVAFLLGLFDAEPQDLTIERTWNDDKHLPVRSNDTSAVKLCFVVQLILLLQSQTASHSEGISVQRFPILLL